MINTYYLVSRLPPSPPGERGACATNKLSFDTSSDTDDLPDIDLNDNTSKRKRKNLPTTKGWLDSSDDSDSCLDVSDYDLCHGNFDPTPVERSSSSEEDEPIPSDEKLVKRFVLVDVDFAGRKVASIRDIDEGVITARIMKPASSERDERIWLWPSLTTLRHSPKMQ